MEFADWIAILTLLGGSGIIATLVTLLYNWRHSKTQREIEARKEVIARDFEARRDAKEYYRTLYAHIGILDELARTYKRSLPTGKAVAFDFKNCTSIEKTSSAILKEYEKAYEEFSSFYIKKKCEGYEIFVSKELKNLLIEFWALAKKFNDDKNTMKNIEKIDEFSKVSEKTTDYMEKLFGLSDMEGEN